MNDERLMKILVAPHVSEKSARIADASNQVVFRVLPDACKPEIKRAVEKLFNVEVDHVRTVSVKGKRKMFQRTPGKRSDWKKAYVRLKPGHDIDFIGGE
ncbi:MAG: 50S ribosomal protein L23 [Gammaproteobacteria bacterium]|jgi:large subunit ribosomal protein L23|nr:50S ribosomal protein L23 [Gammaproteobacteria bacterium]MDX2460004.1 50S ribosomal protein L23 [Gammaproteobacteria bacterium]